MNRDPIVDEIRRIRDRQAAKFNYDLDAIYRHLKKSESQARKRGVAYLSPPRRSKARLAK